MTALIIYLLAGLVICSTKNWRSSGPEEKLVLALLIMLCWPLLPIIHWLDIDN